MFCPKCGKEVPDNAQYCPYCGEPLKKQEEIIEKDVPSGISTKNRKLAFILTFITGAFGLLVFLLILLFGIGWYFFLLAGLYVFVFVFTMVSYNKIELTQKDLNAYNRIYGVTKKGKETGNAFKSLKEVRGLNKQNVYLIAAGKKGLGILGFILYIFSVMGVLASCVFAFTGLSGMGLNLDGVYVQSSSSYSGNGISQVGKTAYKLEGNYIYYTASYDGDNTGWSQGFTYYRTGSKITYTFTGGGMKSTHDLYFVNFGQNIASDRFGFSIAYTKK